MAQMGKSESVGRKTKLHAEPKQDPKNKGRANKKSFPRV